MYTNTYQILKLMSFEDNVKGHFKNKHGDTLFFMFYFLFLIIIWICMQEIRKINHNFNYTHTSLRAVYYAFMTDSNIFKKHLSTFMNQQIHNFQISLRQENPGILLNYNWINWVLYDFFWNVGWFCGLSGLLSWFCQKMSQILGIFFLIFFLCQVDLFCISISFIRLRS